MKLSVEGLNSYYGPAHILFDVGLEVGDQLVREPAELLGKRLVREHRIDADAVDADARGDRLVVP